jgi:hypothetical protein
MDEFESDDREQDSESRPWGRFARQAPPDNAPLQLTEDGKRMFAEICRWPDDEPGQSEG